MSTNEITLTEDILDSRDVIARLDYLQEAKDAFDEGEVDDPLTSDERDELNALRELANQAEGCADWQYSEALIHDNYFEQYAEDLANDICDMQDNQWPFRHIDWGAAADELKQDYTPVGDYWIRS